MRHQEKRLILDALRELEALLAQLHGRLMFRAGYIKEPQAIRTGKCPGVSPTCWHSCTGPRVDLDHFRGRVSLGRHQCRSQGG